jgi:hypothetical protein
MNKYTPLAILPFLPLLASAQGTSLQTFFSTILTLINDTIIPFLFGIAFLIFAINVIKYFVVGGSNKDAQEDAKNVATYSVAAFVFLIIFWGIVEMLAESTGLEECTQMQNDYVDMNTTTPLPPHCLPAQN